MVRHENDLCHLSPCGVLPTRFLTSMHALHTQADVPSSNARCNAQHVPPLLPSSQTEKENKEQWEQRKRRRESPSLSVSAQPDCAQLASHFESQRSSGRSALPSSPLRPPPPSRLTITKRHHGTVGTTEKKKRESVSVCVC